MKTLSTLRILSSYVIVVTSTTLYAVSSPEEIYTKGVATQLFFSMDDLMNRGRYSFDDDDRSINAYIIPFAYQVDNDDDRYNFFLTGEIGFDTYEEGNLNLGRNSIDTVDMRNYTFKVGGGTRINISEDSDIMLGAAYLYSNIESEYKTALPLDITNSSEDRFIDTFLNKYSTFHTYELSASIGYHPIVNDYKPYIRGEVRYFNTRTNENIDSLSNLTTVMSKVRTGVITPELTTVYSYLVNTELYAAYLNLSNDMEEITNISHFMTVGNTFYIKSPLPIDCVDKITFDTSYTKGNNFNGYNISLGFVLGF